MGIRGLTSFINGTQKFYVPYKLSSSYVVIDGSLLMTIYTKLTDDDPRLGGDCKKIYDTAFRLFKRFKQCGVTPIFIRKGVKEEKEFIHNLAKEEEAFKDLISYKKNGYTSDNSMKIIFRNSAFFEALDDLEIFYCRADFASGPEIAEISKGLKCPVISNDSDFFIYDGVDFLHWDFVKFTENSDLDHIECLLFDRQKFLKEYSISNSVLPLIQVIFDTDFYGRNMLEAIGRTNYRCSLTDKIKRGLIWLKGETISSAKEKILKEVSWRASDPHRMEIEREIDSVINKYTKTSTSLASVLESKFNLKNLFTVKEKTLVSAFNLPPDIVNLVRSYKFPSTFFTMFTFREYRCRTVLEDITQECVYEPSIPLIQGIYGVLMRNEETKPPLNIFIRKGEKLISVKKYPIELPQGVLSDDQKLKIFLQIVNINMQTWEFVNEFFGDIDGWVLFTLSHIYFEKKRREMKDFEIPTFRPMLRTALLLHILKIRERNEADENAREGGPLTLKDYYNNFAKEDCEKISRDVLDLDIKKSDVCSINEFNVKQIHYYLTFQAVLYFVKRLSQILSLNLNFGPSYFINGSLFYHFTNSPCGDEPCGNYFFQEEHAMLFFTSIVDRFEHSLSLEEF